MADVNYQIPLNFLDDKRICLNIFFFFVSIKGISIFEYPRSHIFLPQSIYQIGQYYLFK